MAGQVLETARPSVLSPELELQLMVGNTVEALLRLEGNPTDPGSRDTIEGTAARLKTGANLLG